MGDPAKYDMDSLKVKIKYDLRSAKYDVEEPADRTTQALQRQVEADEGTSRALRSEHAAPRRSSRVLHSENKAVENKYDSAFGRQGLPNTK